jgi:hypothetical protein
MTKSATKMRRGAVYEGDKEHSRSTRTVNFICLGAQGEARCVWFLGCAGCLPHVLCPDRWQKQKTDYQAGDGAGFHGFLNHFPGSKDLSTVFAASPDTDSRLST